MSRSSGFREWWNVQANCTVKHSFQSDTMTSLDVGCCQHKDGNDFHLCVDDDVHDDFVRVLVLVICSRLGDSRQHKVRSSATSFDVIGIRFEDLYFFF